ncbi:MAG: hypothetical protein ACRD0W_00880 [Acidimicrobiales bacterium]
MKAREVKELHRIDTRIEALRQSRMDATGYPRTVLCDQIDKLLDERMFYMREAGVAKPADEEPLL